jgi:hypothetical protein
MIEKMLGIAARNLILAYESHQFYRCRIVGVLS